MLAFSTACAAGHLPLDRAVLSLRDTGIRAVALHRPPTAAEARALRGIAHGLRFVAVFGDAPGADVGAPVLVVEGGPAAEDREASLDALCRRLHAFRGLRVALRTPRDADHHPAPGEIELVREVLPFAGYWHDVARGGAAHLEAAARFLFGASLDPLRTDGLKALRDALPGGAPVVIVCPPEECAEALRCARGVLPA